MEQEFQSKRDKLLKRKSTLNYHLHQVSRLQARLNQRFEELVRMLRHTAFQLQKNHTKGAEK